MSDMEKDSTNINVQDLILSQNPWLNHQNKNWADTDGDLFELKKAEAQGLANAYPKQLFFLKKRFFEALFSDPKKSGIIILKGPRRVGKTSTLKLIIDIMIKEGYPAESFLYLSLDREELFTEINKKKNLLTLLVDLIKAHKKLGNPLILILDEITFYPGWAKVLKNLDATGLAKEGVGIIATGSYAVDLTEARSLLSGRFGKLGEECGEELVFVPRRFVEVAESILGNSTGFTDFFSKEFLGNKAGFARRVGILEYLAGYQGQRENEMFGYEKKLKSLLDRFYDELHNLFLETYFYAGGYPRKVYEALISTREGSTSIPDVRYISDIYNLLLKDAPKFGLDESKLKQIILKIVYPVLFLDGGLDVFRNELQMKKEECEKYTNYLTTSGLFSIIKGVSKPDQIDFKTKFVNVGEDKLKFIVNDPAAYFAIFFGSRGNTYNIFERSKLRVKEDARARGFLFESVLLSHLVHMPVIKRSQLKENISFVCHKEGTSEEELVDGFVWYLNFKEDFVIIPLEAKSSESNLRKEEMYEKAKKLKQNFGFRRIIFAVNHKTLEINEDFVIIPLELLLLLM